MVASVIIIWVIFSPLAALMAYLITYAEYSHHYPDRGPVIRAALRAAIVAFLFFLVLGIAVSFVLSGILE